jgi:NitT/TauT family transport system substrate-binding protein
MNETFASLARHVLAIICGFPLLCYAVSAPSGAEPLRKVTIMETTNAITPTEIVVIGAIPNRLGYYKEEGLDVTILQGSGPANAAQILQSGSADFATTMPESILQMREQRGDLVAFYTLTQDNGNALAVKADSPINKLEDLKGKTIGALSWASGGGALLIRSLANLGIKDTEYTKVITPPGPATAVSLKTGQVDALILWYSAYKPMELNGLGLKFIDVPAVHEVGGYSLATTDKFLRENPAVVEGLCRAINKGYVFARKNPDAAIDLFMKEFPAYTPASLNKALAANQYKQILQAWLQTAVQGIPMEGPAGVMSPDRWKYTQQFYTAMGQLKGSTPFSEGFTDKVLPACNQFDHKAVEDASLSYRADGTK